jgi:hypothetical protein
VAPRGFVNHLWQAALHDARSSRTACPACGRPFTEFRGAGLGRQLKVCVGCFWVWVGPQAVESLPEGRAPMLLEGPAPAEAGRVLGSLAAGVVRRVL